MAIEHQIPIVPITFADNKERMSYTFLSGSPGIMRAKIHSFVYTTGKNIENKKDIKDLKDQTRDIILNQLETYQK